MPPVIAQNRKAISIGSLIAERNRTIDSAPTMPRESSALEVTVRIAMVVIIVMAIRLPPKLLDSITPLYVFRYTR